MKLTEEERYSEVKETDVFIGIPKIRKVFPKLLSNVTVGVQPITQPARNKVRSSLFV
jgi:hypothetical protein